FRRSPILLPVVILGPGVEMEMDDGRLAFPSAPFSSLPSYEDGPGVPGPATVRWVRDELHPFQIGPGAAQITPRKPLFRLIIDEDSDDLSRCDFPNYLAINPSNRVEFVRPIVGIVRPGQPGRLMRLPFGRHRKT